MREGFNVVIGAQAGSEAKGKLSSFLANKYKPSAISMTCSPNAGHTYVDNEGGKHITYHLPTAALTCEADIVLGPASLIRVDGFLAEVDRHGISPYRVHISPRASIIKPEHVMGEEHARLSDIGSTLQGVGAARSHKMSRDMGVVFAADVEELRHRFVICETEELLADVLSDSNRGVVLHECTQGWDLCLEHGIHPRYCTSKMVNTAMAMAEAGVNPRHLAEVYGVLRPYPIRVSNRTGTSGPYAGAGEISWEDVAESCGYPGKVDDFGEYTTTTKLPRRVFTFSWERFRAFVRTCGPTQLCLQFANYVNWGDYGKSEWDELSGEVKGFVHRLELEAECPVGFIGTGPRDEEMVMRAVG
jgi:adenylosuccinate synthase